MPKKEAFVLDDIANLINDMSYAKKLETSG